MVNGTPAVRYLVFGAGQMVLAVALSEVLRVLRPLPLTRVPHAPHCLEGVINLEHEIVPVLRLDCTLGLPQAAAEPLGERVLLVEVDGAPLGLHVDRVNAIRSLPDEMTVLAPDEFAGLDGALLFGVCETAPGETVAILNLAQVQARAFAARVEPAAA